MSLWKNERKHLKRENKMAWYTVPSLIVTVLTIFQIFINGKKVDVESVKREILIILIKGLLISIPIYLLEMIMLFFIYPDHKYYKFYNEIISVYSLDLYFFITFGVLLVLVLFPYFTKDTTSIEKYGDEYLIQSKSFYDQDFYIELTYFIKKRVHLLGSFFSLFLIRILLFSSVLVLIVGILQFVPNGRMNDDKHPYVADEKIYIESIDPINVYVVKNGKLQQSSLPSNTKFSIAKGTNFSFHYNKLKNKISGGENNIHNGIYGLTPGTMISLEDDTLIYFEEIKDYTLFVNDKNNEISEFFTTKTIPGNTYLKQNSKEKFKIVNRLNNKETNKPYKFIVGNTVSDIYYKLFLKNVIQVNSLLVLITLFLALFMTKRYIYIVINWFISSILLIFSIGYFLKTKEWNIVTIIVLLVILTLVIIEIFKYTQFLRQNVLIRRLKSLSEINLKLSRSNYKILFDSSSKEEVDIPIEEDKHLYFEGFNYDSKHIEKDMQKEGTVKIILYSSVKDILSEYFSRYSILYKIVWIPFKKIVNLYKRNSN